MATYFSLNFELNKSKDVIETFYKNLIDFGFKFKSGYGRFENDFLEDIIAWNQKKLDEDFKIGVSEHCSDDYKQLLFEFNEFSEVRVFIMNRKGMDSFFITMIIPEKDLLVSLDEYLGECSAELNKEKVEQLISLAKRIWVNIDTLAIQTGWEISGFPVLIEDIKNGTMKPQTEPFCIVKSSFTEMESLDAYEKIGRNGLLIEDKIKWNY